MNLTFENYLAGDTAPSLVVIYPGRFQPAHKNHAKVYNFLVQQFPYASVYVTTSNKLKLPKSPFTFDEKKLMLEAAGIPANAIIQTVNPYVSQEVTKKFDSNIYKLIFAVGGKDMLPEAPRFNFLPTKKGDAYFKPLSSIKKITKNQINKLECFSSHGYVATTPTFNFSLSVAGERIKIESASVIRNLYSRASESGRKDIITQLYDGFNEQIYELFNLRLT